MIEDEEYTCEDDCEDDFDDNESTCDDVNTACKEVCDLIEDSDDSYNKKKVFPDLPKPLGLLSLILLFLV